jgi:hypothetical protein
LGLFLKQSTAVDVIVGPFIDDSDGKTAETGLTITQAEVRLSKNGGNMAQKNEATALTHDELGYYDCNLDTTDTNTLGRLQLMIFESGALPVYHEYMVLTANVYDSLCSTDILQSDLIQMGGVAQSGTDLKDFADAGYDPATNKVTGVVLTDTTTAVTNDVGITATAVDNVWDELMAGHITVDSAAYVMRTLQSIISVVSLAQAGAATSITLAAASSAVNDFYNGQTVCIITGTGAGQARAIYDYDGGTKVASVRPSWATAPDNTSYYAILNVGSTVTAAIESAAVDTIWDEAMEGALTAREQMNVNHAVLAGKSAGGGTATITFRDAGDAKDRQSATVDADGNRTAVVTDGA